jgi:hypothetical protein
MTHVKLASAHGLQIEDTHGATGAKEVTLAALQHIFEECQQVDNAECALQATRLACWQERSRVACAARWT